METAYASLKYQFNQWDLLRVELEELSLLQPDENSTLALDNRALTTDTTSLALTRYVYERVYNTVRTLKKLNHLVFDFDPPQIHLDYTTMYPLMRSVIEDTSTISWLVSDGSKNERLTRGLHIFATENDYFVDNLKLLARAHQETSGEPSHQLEAKLESQRKELRDLLSSTANRLDLDPDRITKKKVSNRQPIAELYGNNSTPLFAWKLLSDLSHFSFMTMRHMATTSVPDYAGSPLNQVTMITLAAAMGRCAHDASQHLRTSISAVEGKA